MVGHHSVQEHSIFHVTPGMVSCRDGAGATVVRLSPAWCRWMTVPSPKVGFIAAGSVAARRWAALAIVPTDDSTVAEDDPPCPAIAPGAVADADAMSMRLGCRRPLIWQRLVHPLVGDAVIANREIVIAEYVNASVPAVLIKLFQRRGQSVGSQGAGDVLRFALQAAIPFFVSTAMAAAAELDGVVMPDKQDIAGHHLVLNGLGLRTYSLLRIHIYVAGLYLERRTTDPAAILVSNQPKMLRFVFLRDVSAEDARKSWREALDRNCPAPCRLPANSIERFLAAIPSVHSGDTNTLLFTGRGVEFFINGQSAGRIENPDFKQVILSTFIGPSPTSEEVKAGLLGAQG